MFSSSIVEVLVIQNKEYISWACLHKGLDEFWLKGWEQKKYKQFEFMPLKGMSMFFSFLFLSGYNEDVVGTTFLGSME